MAEVRIPRAQESRELEARPTSWQPPEKLPTPIMEDGYVYRWVRLSAYGEMDATNLSSKLREGYTYVKASDHPELKILAAEGDRVEVGGLVLCKIPTEFVAQRKAYYNNQTHHQMEAVDNNFMRDNDGRMPLFKQRTSKVVFGSGT